MNEGSLTQPSPGAVLLPSTLGIPARHGSPESRRRDPRLLWAPAISISGKTDQPLLTPQYRKRERRLVEKNEQIKLDPKVRTDADLSHLTRVGNHRTQLPISFLPHRINPSKIPPSVRHRGSLSISLLVTSVRNAFVRSCTQDRVRPVINRRKPCSTLNNLVFVFVR